MFYQTTYPSPLGTLTIASDAGGENLVGLWLEGQKYFGGSLSQPMETRDDIPLFNSAKQWLARYFAGGKPALSELPLAPQGSPFRQAVWAILRDIPYGQVCTYGDIARKLAQAQGKASVSSQAVGGAVGHNPLSILIPCHRVVGSDGSLTGYAGGIAKKIQLLELEGVDTSRFSIPAKGTAL